MSVKIYHNPRCSKSRQTLSLLKERDIQPEIIEYLNNPPSAETIKLILTLLDRSPRELMRTKEELYKQLALNNPELSDTQLIQAMVEHPKLIERPIVIHDGKAAIGRPPESVLEII